MEQSRVRRVEVQAERNKLQIQLQEDHRTTRKAQIRKTTLSYQTQAWPFKTPVKKEEVPDYHEIIKNPMDLQTIRENNKASKYKTKEAFQDDIMLIIKNAKTYNQKNTIYYKCAMELQIFAEKLLAHLKYDFNQEDEQEDEEIKGKPSKKLKI